jgi:hypothetical protein
MPRRDSSFGRVTVIFLRAVRASWGQLDPQKKEIKMDEAVPFTLTVPEAGKRYFGLSRNAAYAAAGRGEIPTVRIGRLLRVPVRALERLLDRADQQHTAA